MTRVEASSRLHFGLLNIRGQQLGLRQFGGCGLMIQSPGLVVEASKSGSFQAIGPHAERALKFAKLILKHQRIDEAVSLKVVAAPPEHVGLGVGTQLAFATAMAVQAELALVPYPVSQTAEFLGRSSRSAIGLHGFLQGGFLVDGGRTLSTNPAPLVGRYAFPEDWPIVLARPKVEANWSGQQEVNAFAAHQQNGWNGLTDQMSSRLLLGMIPAILEKDYLDFCESLGEYNRLAGEQFSQEQGGIYSSPEVAELVQFIQQQGLFGVGQSSWGPTVFAICEDLAQASTLMAKLNSMPNLEVTLTKAANHGATLTQ